jgi:beta-glucanase (GH16 family)
VDALARVGMVTVLVAVGISASTNSQFARAEPHGCSQPWSTLSTERPPSFFSLNADASLSPSGSSETESTEIFDSFDGPAGTPPNPDKWTVVEGVGWDRGIQEYTADNAVLDGQGHLMLRAQRTDSGHASGRVETRRKANFGYGTLIARIKMPAGTGLWPAFWLLGADEDTNPWPGAGEVDVVEVVSDSRKWYSSLHGPISGVEDYLQVQISGEGPDLSADFHDYWVIRSENSITVGIDDTVWGTFTPDSLPPTAEWVYNKPFCVILNLAVGGEWAGPPDSSTKFPALMLVDYVHWEPA